MKKLIAFIFIIFTTTNVYAQDQTTDSIKHLLSREKADTERVNLLVFLGRQFVFGGSVSKDSSLAYLQQALDLSKKINYIKGLIAAQGAITYTLNFSGNYPEALELALRNLRMAEQFRDSNGLFSQTRAVVWIYWHIGDNQAALIYSKKLALIANAGTYRVPERMEVLKGIANENLGESYSNLNQFDSAMHYLSLAYKYALKEKSYEMLAVVGYSLGNTYAKLGNNDSAFSLYRQLFLTP